MRESVCESLRENVCVCTFERDGTLVLLQHVCVCAFCEREMGGVLVREGESDRERGSE